MNSLIIAALLMMSTPVSIPTEEAVAGIAVAIEAADELPDPVEVITAARQAEIEQYIEEYSTLYDIDADLTRAVIKAESDGKIRAFNVNKNGSKDYGLMQINECNHEWLKKELGITDFYDIKQNIHCGVFMIADLMSRHDSLHTVLMAYNMGEKKTRELHKKGVYTSKYSRKIMKIYEELKEETK